jgi:hypothetical protein
MQITDTQLPKEVEQKLNKISMLIDEILDVESVRFTLKMRDKLGEAQLILMSIISSED